MRRRRALVALAGLLAVSGCDRLPSRMTIEQVVAELKPAAPSGGPSDAEVRRVLQPGDRAGGGAPRPALVAPLGTPLTARVQVPESTVLRFSAGVEGEKRRDTSRSGIEFRVSVDGREAYRERINPAESRRDRRWFDGAIDLAPWRGKSVDVVFETRAEDASRAVAGTAGWSHLRVVQETRRERQRADAGVNVILMLVDTLRADRLGIYGASPSPSPALDAFAARGLVFDVMVSQASWTMPAVASIFTGLHPRSHGAVGPDVHEGDHDAGGGTILADGVTTIAELAQQAGVTTFGVSSNMLVSRATNLAQGFETFAELPFDRDRRDYAPASAVNQEFLDWLPKARDLRFFAYLHYMEPHGPYAPPAPLRPAPPEGIRADLAAGWVQDFARNFDRGQVGPPSAPAIAHLRKLYDGDIRSWDDAFGALVSTLAARGVLDRTIIIVVADHGEEFFEHGKLTHGAHLYDETVHIPLVLVGPGIAAGRRQDMAPQIDLPPLVTALLGASTPAGLSGRDLFTTRDGVDAVSEIVSGFGDDGAGAGTVSLRTPRWKMIRPAGGAVELYDLAADPGESTNLGPDAPETAALAARLDRWASAAPRPPQTEETDPGLRKRLRQLGYVE